MEEDIDDVLVVRMQGVFPSGLVERATRQLDFFKRLRKRGTFYSRLYPERADPIEQANHMFFEEATPLFNQLRRCDFIPSYFGALGCVGHLDPSDGDFSPKPFMEWSGMGLEGFSKQDTQHCKYACYLRDEETLAEARDYLSGRRDDRRMTFVSLLACDDIRRIDWRHGHCDANMYLPEDMLEGHGSDSCDDEYLHPESVTGDHASSDPSAPSRSISSIGQYFELEERSSLVRTSNAARVATLMQDFCWSILKHLDAQLSSLVAENPTLSVCLLCDRACSLFEHACIVDLPWDACLRGFAILPSTCQKVVRSPVSARFVLSCFLQSMDVKWSCSLSEGCAATLSVHPFVNVKHPCFCRCVFAHDASVFSMTVWFECKMRESNDMDEWIENPVLRRDSTQIRSIYNLTSDPHELHNLAGSKDWMEGRFAAHVQRVFDATVADAKLSNIYVKKNRVSNMGAALCCDRVMQDAETQTEETGDEGNILSLHHGHGLPMQILQQLKDYPKGMTMFSKDDASEDDLVHPPPWMPEPLAEGFMSDDLMQRASRSSGRVKTISGGHADVKLDRRGDLVIGNVRVLLERRSIHHIRDRKLVIYKVQKVVAEEPAMVSSSSHESMRSPIERLKSSFAKSKKDSFSRKNAMPADKRSTEKAVQDEDDRSETNTDAPPSPQSSVGGESRSTSSQRISRKSIQDKTTTRVTSKGSVRDSVLSNSKAREAKAREVARIRMAERR